MSHPDIEVRGCLFSACFSKQHGTSILKAIKTSGFADFVCEITQEVIEKDLDTEWVGPSYIQAYTFMGVFKSVFNYGGQMDQVRKMKRFLEALYLKSNSRVRLCIAHGIVEHLFENSKIRALFANWKDDRVLARAYKQAEAWIDPEVWKKAGMTHPSRSRPKLVRIAAAHSERGPRPTRD